MELLVPRVGGNREIPAYFFCAPAGTAPAHAKPREHQPTQPQKAFLHKRNGDRNLRRRIIIVIFTENYAMKLILTLLLAGSCLVSCRHEAADKQASTTGIAGTPLAADMIFSLNGRLRTTSAVMQSFDIDSRGEIYYSQLNRKYRGYISHGRASEPYTESMQLLFSGHVSNISVEECGDERYIWVSNYATRKADGHYWDSQIVSRIEFVPDAVMLPEDAGENYYTGEKNIAPAVDFEGDMITFLCITDGHFTTYRLSEARALEPEAIMLDSISRGGEKTQYADARDAERIRPTVLARDLRRIKPLGSFYVKRTGDVPWQGFDIHDGRIYQAEGAGSSDGTPSKAYLTVYGIDGKVLERRTQVAAVADTAALRAMGITDTGYMEAEGVKIRRGSMYLGYASKNSQDKRYATILEYEPSDK